MYWTKNWRRCCWFCKPHFHFSVSMPFIYFYTHPKFFHIPKLKFLHHSVKFCGSGFLLLCWFDIMHWCYFPRFIQIFAVCSTVMEFCRQQCKPTEMENSWGADFQCNYQQMGVQNACITLPMNTAPHGKEHLFHIWFINSTKIEHFVCRQVENNTI